MRNTRLFTSTSLFPDARLSLTGHSAHYLAHVLRFKAGAHIHLFNGIDGEWQAELLKIHKKSVDLRIQQRLRAPEETQTHLFLFFAPLKPHRLEMLIEKATEMGTTHFVPCETHHTTVRQLNLKRWEAIALSATEQCGRLTPPLFLPFAPLEVHLQGWQARAPFFFGDIGNTSSFWKQLQTLHPPLPPSQIGFLVGPEGGWSLEEKHLLDSSPFARGVSLGPTVLRAETAALLGIGLLRLALLTP